MADLTQDAALAAKQAQDSELVALKQQMDRLRADLTPGKTGMQKLRKACTDFEAVFITKMWEQMRATIPKGGLMHSPQEDMYRSMFDRDFAEKLAGDGGIGLGDMLYNQLKDKLKNTTKTPGSDMLQSGAAGAAGTVERRELRMPRRGAAPAEQGAQAAAPPQPASVAGELMPEVENLARRIEADYDRRQAAAYTRQDSGPGRLIATVG